MWNGTIVDTHLHIWDMDRLDYPWVRSVPNLNRSFTIGDFQAASASVPLTKMVFLQCDVAPSQRFDEIEFVKEAARIDERLTAIVPFVPLELGETVFGELDRLADDPWIRGVRRILQGESDSEYCLRPDFVRAVNRLGTLGLHFEICIYHGQMRGAMELVKRCPEVVFILDHIGKPNIRQGQLTPWRDELIEMAKRQNIWCKFSGLVTEAEHCSWTVDDLRPYADTVFEAFGFDRVMFGGDWPVATLAATYDEWYEAARLLTTGCSDAEIEALFSSNAIRFYRL